jgi:hypothetical protein
MPKVLAWNFTSISGNLRKIANKLLYGLNLFFLLVYLFERTDNYHEHNHNSNYYCHYDRSYQNC